MEFLLYIQFVADLWTLVGGVKTISARFNNELVETQDFEKNYRILIPGSGVRSLDLDGSGVLDFEQGSDMIERMWDFHKNGSVLRARMVGSGITIEGGFILKDFSLDSQFQDANQFQWNLISSGDFDISRG